ncbi:MAG: nucleotidyltransferase substrate binding protein [Deltaproteobacteria bacterium]|nr:nucleotidyltransferase substrate binding protein [Deltaproteobacteria bacterium]
MNKDIRWRQRFANLEKAYRLLEQARGIVHPSPAERGGLIQFFETVFELSWKTLKDYLEAQGLTAGTPREAIKHAFQIDLIDDGQQWMKMLEDRHLTAHTYDEATSLKVEKLVKETYFPLFQALYGVLKSKM